MNEIRVTSWAELQERLFDDTWQPGMQRFRSSQAFRGIHDAAARLSTSLDRLSPNQEQHLLRNFRKYAQREGGEATVRDSVWNWLAIAQHHGLPTRLLDWSFSPYVALHFVTEYTDTYAHDGVIWCVDYVKAHAKLPEPLRRVLAEEQADVFTAEMLARVADTLTKFDELGAGAPFVAFFEPPSIDQRIINQFALFSLMSGHAPRLDEWLREQSDISHRLIIPAELKWEIRDKLDQANITERVLFPGLDGLSRWLKRYYYQRADAGDESSDAHV